MATRGVHVFWSLCLALVLSLSLAGSAEQKNVVELNNGLVRMSVALPDKRDGFYRGTRFDWSGIIRKLTYAGHSYYGEWFDRIDASVRDYDASGVEIVAGNASAATGPAEEFNGQDNVPLGFAEAKPGHTFVKIGVGVLRNPDNQRYSPYRNYDIVDSGTWSVKRVNDRTVIFTQKVFDPESGYGYRYTKQLTLARHSPVLTMEHEITNIGKREIATRLYNHNFLVLDHMVSGPGFIATMPFPVLPQKPVRADLGTVEGGQIRYRRNLLGKEVFAVHMGGLRNTIADYDFRIENSEAHAGVHVTGDRAAVDMELWSIRSTIALEPTIEVRAPIGKYDRWSYRYEFYETSH